MLSVREMSDMDTPQFFGFFLLLPKNGRHINANSCSNAYDLMNCAHGTHKYKCFKCKIKVDGLNKDGGNAMQGEMNAWAAWTSVTDGPTDGQWTLTDIWNG